MGEFFGVEECPLSFLYPLGFKMNIFLAKLNIFRFSPTPKSIFRRGKSGILFDAESDMRDDVDEVP